MKTEKRDLVIRPRRLRRTDVLQRLVREIHMHLDDFIAPVFIIAGENKKNSIPSMPGVYQWSMDRVHEEIDELLAAGIDKIILFGIPKAKDSTGSDSYSSEGIIQQSLRKIKQQFSDLFIITDICFCEYTNHGHCGVIQDNDVHNDSTLPLLGKQALSHVEAGADMVAPSGMMDGMVGEIRFALDAAGFDHIPIMSFAVKYASAFYGPFRDAVDSTPQFSDRKSYQMDPSNIREAMKEVELDILEGVDIIMVKPALAYLDVISHIKDISNIPVACYNVSGEYSMLKAAAEKGWIDHDSAMMEMLISMKRAGADIIISYFAKEAAQLINN
tara:strand:+ start:112 stop:1098 length:987 start_codon:yes stop_codon:yes gene_type:complete